MFNHDFAKKIGSFQSAYTLLPWRKWIRFVVIAAVCSVPLLALLGSGEGVRASVNPAFLEEWIPAKTLPVNREMREQRVLLRAGDTTQIVLAKLGFSIGDAADIVRAAEKVFSLRRVRAGNEWSRRPVDGEMNVYYQVDAERILHLRPKNGGWNATIEPRQASTRTGTIEGIINDNLFIDAARSGMDDRTTMNLVEIFSWDIDFGRDLRKGDRFKVLLEETFDANGKALGKTILAAEFINQGHGYQAVRFTQKGSNADYFTPDGKNLRKAYLRSPVKFSRISSRFSSRRKHPVLGYTRAHKGVDYAARSGTPIRAVGDGRVAYKGRKGGYGRYIKIRHKNSAHTTSYAHLSRYARGLRRGKQVRQGQVIGYVGMSGLATGPHLHFEFRIRGRAVNPLTIKSPSVQPVPKKEMVHFLALKNHLLARLEYTTGNLAWS